ncbi:peptide chain release factor N(5)-glutamine methyltransferase [Mycoplasmopsis caviae]|uniref:peptide chain release factor N(5)-glutamine methyltransferase n=1 Tax=Mycoplasmopsis caviae TaxID=55603 RepID=A0A3P8KWM4_9BACT|nr:peptide chain release factor N(5)-glutamine methyltransferase [Mycoplasmopsis caviae]UUD35386.1 peptide chain release factor N(5)-glutamine methyltransferase [Mycoplasmopsis caviae]VDR41837.1 protoporphyrinogen oxidase [Mycoplasmopsis caviae]
MNREEALILEKKRYGLEPKISEQEYELLKQNYPIQLIMGYVEYLNTRINLRRKVLIPRYETEELVDIFLKEFAKENQEILDLCCGSGFIGLAIKKNLPSARVSLVDISEEAIKQTIENSIVNFGFNHDLKIYQSDLFTTVKEKFDIIISNPPYLDIKDQSIDLVALGFEPESALFAPQEGWYFYDKILKQYKNYLKKKGWLILEINPQHIDKWKQIEGAIIRKDINGKYRFVFIQNV